MKTNLQLRSRKWPIFDIVMWNFEGQWRDIKNLFSTKSSKWHALVESQRSFQAFRPIQSCVQNNDGFLVISRWGLEIRHKIDTWRCLLAPVDLKMRFLGCPISNWQNYVGFPPDSHRFNLMESERPAKLYASRRMQKRGYVRKWFFVPVIQEAR